MSETIQQRLIAVMQDVQSVAKSDRNQQQGFNFRGIDAVINAVGPAFRKHGVFVLPSVRESEYGQVTIGKNATQMGHVRMLVEFTFTGIDGDSVACTVACEAMDSGDKATAKAMSVGLRTALLQVLALPTDEPDPDASSYERSPQVALDNGVVEGVLKALADATGSEDLDRIAGDLRTMEMSEQQRAVLIGAFKAAKERVGA
jgi:hypothetical protein